MWVVVNVPSFATELFPSHNRVRVKMLYYVQFYFFSSSSSLLLLFIIVARTLVRMIETPIDLDKSFNEIEINNSFLSNVYPTRLCTVSLSHSLTFPPTWKFLLGVRLIWWKFSYASCSKRVEEYGNVYILSVYLRSAAIQLTKLCV